MAMKPLSTVRWSSTLLVIIFCAWTSFLWPLQSVAAQEVPLGGTSAVTGTLEPEAEIITTEAVSTAAPVTEDSGDSGGRTPEGKLEEETTTTATTTTTTTTTPTTTTTSLPTTTTGTAIGIGGVFSNAISGGEGDGSSVIASVLGEKARIVASTPSPRKGNFDKHLDTILMNLGRAVKQNGFDPLRLGKVLQCRNCTMEGLSLARRVGPSNFHYANRTLTIDAHIGLPALYIACFPCIDVILMVPLTGMLEVALWDLRIYGKVTQKNVQGESPKLVEYRVEREGDLDINLNGYGILAPVTELGFKFLYQRQVSEIVRDLIYERIPGFLQEKLKGFTLPFGK